MLTVISLLSLPAAKHFLGQGLLFICFCIGCTFLLQMTSSDLLVSKCLIWICFCSYWEADVKVGPNAATVQSWTLLFNVQFRTGIVQCLFCVVAMRFLGDLCCISRGILLYSLQAKHRDCFSALLCPVLCTGRVPCASCKATWRPTQCSLRRGLL